MRDKKPRGAGGYPEQNGDTITGTVFAVTRRPGSSGTLTGTSSPSLRLAGGSQRGPEANG